MSGVQIISQGTGSNPGATHMRSGSAGFLAWRRERCSGALRRQIDMATPLSHRPLRLNTGELVNIQDGKGLEVVCLEGAVWITQSNDPRDIVVGATESFMLDKPGLALVCAPAGPATVAIELPQRRDSAARFCGPVMRERAMSEVRDPAWSVQAHMLHLPGGETIAVRPIRPQDTDRLQAYMRDLSVESRRNRFLGAVSELAPTQLDRLAHMCGPGELALLAFADAGSMYVVGEAVMVTAPSGRSEIALSVADAWQGRGVGTLLMQNLECRARMLGACRMYGDVLRTNSAMKALARKAGFSIRGPFTDARLIEIVKDLISEAALPCRDHIALPDRNELRLSDRVGTKTRFGRLPAPPATWARLRTGWPD
jgi:acetyltransferase